ncbi:MAG: PQQ-binding-like beta-propeller repeat protein, partial [Verrucomicrobiae bacterium]|nr:PQQ-binding-like beta-propeller repeat protein [Verrucomicrobiae bacterium]
GSGAYSAPNLPVTWTEKDYHWKKMLPGKGHSSPMVWMDNLYLTCSDGENPGNLLLCFDKTTGKEKWRMLFESQTRQLHRLNTFASSTPAVDPYHVYMAWSDNDHFRIAAISHNGKGVWERNLGTHHTQHGGGSSPVVYRDRVYIANECRGPSAIHALDRMTGESIWKVDRPWDEKGKTSYSTPLLYRPERGEPYLVFNSTSSGMTAINPDNGKTVWQIPDLFPKRTILSPFTVNGLIFGSCGDGNVGFFLAAIRPPLEKGGQPTEAYRIRKAAPYVPTPVAKENRLFLVSDGGIASCVDATTGEEIW